MNPTRPSLLALALAFTAAGCASRPSPEKVVQQMRSTYASLKSYEDHGETAAVTEPGKKPRVVMEERFAYEAPNRYFMGVHAGEHTIVIAASDGKTLQAVRGDSSPALITDAPPALAGSAPVLTKLSVPLMNGPFALLAGAEPLAGREAHLADDETLEGQPMYVVEMSGDEPLRLWIGQKDHLLHRVERTVTTSQNGAPTSQAVTDTRKAISVNQPIPADRLAFALPPHYPVLKVAQLENRPAPAVRLKSLEGERVDLASLRGKVVVLDFWAYWCGPCRMELPSIQRISEEMRPRGVVVYAITEPQRGDEQWTQTRAAIKDLGLTFPTLVDAEGVATREYGVISLPRTIVIDRQGVVRADIEGAQDEDVLQRALVKAGA